jgi:uncharacterized protein
MLNAEREKSEFSWNQLGDLAMGRPNLGLQTHVAVYRLMQYTMRDVLIKNYGTETAEKLFYEAGTVAGREFCKNVLNMTRDFNSFIEELTDKLLELKIGIFKIEKSDLNLMEFIMTVAEDLDCSGLPVTGETVCNFDEGFIAGIFETYTQKNFLVKEIDCWSTGGRICRFHAIKL